MKVCFRCQKEESRRQLSAKSRHEGWPAASSEWRPVDLSLEPVVYDPKTIGVEIGAKVYGSRIVEDPSGPAGYRAFVDLGKRVA